MSDLRKCSKVEKSTIKSLRERIRINHRKIDDMRKEIKRLKKDTMDTHKLLDKLEAEAGNEI